MKLTRPALSLSRRAFAAGIITAGFAKRPAFAQPSDTTMRIRCIFSDQAMIYHLIDNPTTRDLISLLPFDLTIEDFSSNEKIAHLPRKLDKGGLADYDDEAPGDLCYFRGWGNLAFFHDDYTYRGDLIRLGRLEGGVEPLLVKGKFPLRIEQVG